MPFLDNARSSSSSGSIDIYKLHQKDTQDKPSSTTKPKLTSSGEEGGHHSSKSMTSSTSGTTIATPDDNPLDEASKTNSDQHQLSQ